MKDSTGNALWGLLSPKKKILASEYLQRLSTATKKLENYQCRISYLHAQPLFETKSLRAGELFYKKDAGGSFLRINFKTLKEDDDAEQNYRDEWIFDGRWLTHIDYKVKQVKRTEQVEEGEQIDAFELIRQSFPIIGFTKVEELAEQFEIGEAEELSTKVGDFVRLNLKPKAGMDYAEDYKSVEFWMNLELDLPYRIMAVSTEPEEKPDFYEIELTKADAARKIDKKIFEYKIPAGFTVETQRLEDNEN